MAKTAEQQARAQKARGALAWAFLAFLLGSVLVIVDGVMLPKVTDLVISGVTPHLPGWIAVFPAAIVATTIIVVGNLLVVGLVVLVAQAVTGDSIPKIAYVTFVLAVVLVLAIGGSLVGKGTIPLTATPTPAPSATAPAAPSAAGTPTPGSTAVPAPAGTPMH